MVKAWRGYLVCLMWVSCALLPIHNAYANWWWPFGEDTIEYDIAFNGTDAALDNWFNEIKLGEPRELTGQEPMVELEQELVTLENRLRKALNAKGYYEPQIDSEFKADTTPPTLRYDIEPGPQVIVSEIAIRWEGNQLAAPDTEPLEVRPGDVADARLIQEDTAYLYQSIDDATCLLTLEIVPTLQINPRTHKASLIYDIKHGPEADFGTVTISGNDRTRNEAITRHLAWDEGECYSDQAITKTQNALYDTQLFSSVVIEPSMLPGEDGRIPVALTLSERVARTVRAGVNVATDRGLGVRLGWEHRNFNGGAENVTVNAVIAQDEQSLAFSERIPAYWHENQTLALAASIGREDTDAFESTSLHLGATLERQIADSVNGGLGIAYDLSQTEDRVSGSNTYSLISLPAFIEYDRRDDAQDPTSGYFARASITPHQDMFDSNLRFAKTTLLGQTYFAASDITYKPVLALRSRVGSIIGADAIDLPPDLRYYAGGGGSVRGYGYQSLGPRANGDPVGGASLVEMTAELRLRFTDTFGGVAFIDAGNAYADSTPDLGGDLFYGAGIGVRYFSSFGPLRFDVGVPLNGEDINEDGYAIYISIGQAF